MVMSLWPTFLAHPVYNSETKQGDWVNSPDKFSAVTQTDHRSLERTVSSTARFVGSSPYQVPFLFLPTPNDKFVGLQCFDTGRASGL